jgi:hypothetical protein
MHSRERFNRTMNYELADRPPLFEDGVRDNVLQLWRTQGMSKKSRLEALFSFDKREEFEPILDPLPTPSYWPRTSTGLKKLTNHLDPEDPKRFPADWVRKTIAWKNRDYPLILRIHNGYFLTLGVHGWRRFTDAIQLLVDNPVLINEWMNVYAEFSTRMATKILADVDVDAVLFSEPIGGNHGPLISPKMYSSLVLNSYQSILEAIKQFNVPTIIYRTYANTRVLLPSVVKAGFNCLWACESNPQAMNYSDIRSEYGRELRLIGGIDSDSLRQGQYEIQKAVLDTVPALLQEGGFIPLADGRVREDVSFENYVFYRKLLESVCQD